MGSELPISDPKNMYLAQQPTRIDLSGNNNSVYGHVDRVTNEYNSSFYVVENQLALKPNLRSPQPVRINENYYNLIVVAEGDLSEGVYVMVDKAKAIMESTEPELKKIYANLRPEAVAELKTFPTIIASENHKYGNTDEDHFAIYGLIMDVKIQENGIKVYYHRKFLIQQQRLNELSEELEMQRASCCNELDLPHWSIKRVNVEEVFRKNGVQFFQ